jgi:hypothetical protein
MSTFIISAIISRNVATLILLAATATNAWLLFFTLSHRDSPALTGKRGKVRFIVLATHAIFVILLFVWVIIGINKGG